MHILERDWLPANGASPEAVALLRETTPVRLPETFFALLAATNGGEGPLARQPFYVQLDSAEVITEALETARHEEFFDGFVIIGSNGGGEFIAFDVRKAEPWPLVAIDMTNIDLNESVRLIAPDFDSFMRLAGVESAE
ncbi:MAG: SMI1/KNR4 family protein [Rhodomicrobium sp.]